MTFRDRLRAFEKSLESRMPEFNCSVHLCLGQELVPIILSELLRYDDWLFSTHRSHGHYLAKGGDAEKLLAEIEGRPDGVNQGFSGSQSFCDQRIRFHSTAIVGGLIGVATGAAWASKLRHAEEIVVCCIGDAATEQGVFWESLNFAALHSLPIVYLCENNGLSVHAPLEARQARPRLPRASSFGLTVGSGENGLRYVLSNRDKLPAYVEVTCERLCRHVSAMEDLRE